MLSGLQCSHSRAGCAGALLALLLSGCNTTSITLCDRYCDCESCDVARYDACLDDGDQLQEQAASGCDGEAETYLSCAKDNLVCVDGHATFGACDTAYQDLAACLGTAPCCAATRFSAPAR